MSSEKVHPSRAEISSGIQPYALEVFKENNRISALIEDKAQKLLSVVGIVVGAGLAFLRVHTAGSQALHKYSLVFGFVILMASAILAVCVTQVSANPNMPELSQRVIEINTLLEIPSYQFTEGVARNYNSDVADKWINATERQVKINERKARVLLFAQVLLILALVIISTVLLLSVLSQA